MTLDLRSSTMRIDEEQVLIFYQRDSTLEGDVLDENETAAIDEQEVFSKRDVAKHEMTDQPQNSSHR